MRRLLPIGLSAAALALGGSGCSSSAEEPRPAVRAEEDPTAALAGAPAPLAKLHEQENQLLNGGRRAFVARLAELRGHPVVVNKWASWCGPCRAEFPFFQEQAIERGKRVAFLGVDSHDNAGDAREFLEQYPVTYPSYKDPDLDIAAEIKAVAAFPSTVFYDSKGKIAHVKVGGYAKEQQLAEDIERYAR